MLSNSPPDKQHCDLVAWADRSYNKSKLTPVVLQIIYFSDYFQLPLWTESFSRIAK